MGKVYTCFLKYVLLTIYYRKYAGKIFFSQAFTLLLDNHGVYDNVKGAEKSCKRNHFNQIRYSNNCVSTESLSPFFPHKNLLIITRNLASQKTHCRMIFQGKSQIQEVLNGINLGMPTNGSMKLLVT